jgi:hypothetical protein
MPRQKGVINCGRFAITYFVNKINDFILSAIAKLLLIVYIISP